jgi:hypothetical protein
MILTRRCVRTLRLFAIWRIAQGSSPSTRAKRVDGSNYDGVHLYKLKMKSASGGKARWYHELKSKIKNQIAKID